MLEPHYQHQLLNMAYGWNASIVKEFQSLQHCAQVVLHFILTFHSMNSVFQNLSEESLDSKSSM